MKLWILKPVIPQTYNAYQGMVVRATDETAARQLANKSATYDTGGNWLDPEAVTCVELTADGNEEVILESYFGI